MPVKFFGFVLLILTLAMVDALLIRMASDGLVRAFAVSCHQV